MKTAREIAHETIRSVFTGGVWCSYHPKGEAPHSPACDALAVVITVDREETTAALTKELATKVDAINELHVLLADAKRSGAASPALQAAREDWMCGGLEPGATCRRRKYHAGDCKWVARVSRGCFVKTKVDKFTTVGRDAVCVACLEPCYRLFRKTRDGRPWPIDRSICDWCILSMQEAGRKLRSEARPPAAPPGTGEPR